MLAELREQRDGHRRQHHRRRRVADPHREQPGRGHEAQQQPPRVGPEDQDDAQRDPPVQVPALHREREQEPADEQEDDVVEVDRRG